MTSLVNGAISGVQAGSTTANQGTSQNQSGLGSLTQADFIRLITAQLQHQNPTSPQNPQDLANEFADLSTVSGINKLDSKVSQIQSGAAAGELGQAANLVGKTVATTGDSAVAGKNGSLTGAFTLASAASNAIVRITNTATGKQVATVPLSTLSSGTNTFTWSGGTAGQTYRYRVVAATAAGKSVSATPYSTGTVSSVGLSGSNPTVSIAGQTKPVPLSSIKDIVGG